MRAARAALVRQALGDKPQYIGWLAWRLVRRSRDDHRPLTRVQLEQAVDDLAVDGVVSIDVPSQAIRVSPVNGKEATT